MNQRKHPESHQNVKPTSAPSPIEQLTYGRASPKNDTVVPRAYRYILTLILPHPRITYIVANIVTQLITIRVSSETRNVSSI